MCASPSLSLVPSMFKYYFLKVVSSTISIQSTVANLLKRAILIGPIPPRQWLSMLTPGLAMSASPWNMLEMQISMWLLRPTESEILLETQQAVL